MRFPEYETFDGVGLADLVAKGEISPRELVEAAFARINARDGEVGALVRRLEEMAYDAAENVQPGTSPLAGVPTLLKDLGVALEGVPTGNGTRHLLDVPARFTSTVVRRIQDAGLPILGKTSTAQLGLAYTTEPQDLFPTCNPWDRSRTAGGSSGGAGAAVAAGYVPLAHASDGGGSIRVPASANGLVGLKPSRGRVSLGPIVGEAWSGLATNLVVSRSVRDTAAALDIMSGWEPGDPYVAPPPDGLFLEDVGRPSARLRIALMPQFSEACPTDPVCRTAVEDTAKLLEDFGHTVEEAAPEFDREAYQRAFLDTVAGHLLDEVTSIAERLGRSPAPGDFEPTTEAIAEYGRRGGLLQHLRGRTHLQRVARSVGAFFTRFDLLLTPTLAKPPVELGEIDLDCTELEVSGRQMVGFSPFTGLANATGEPAISLPLYWSTDGLPIGTMLHGPLGSEATLLQVAAQCESARPWFNKRPPHLV